MKVAKNTLIKKALEALDNERYSSVYDSLHGVTALMFTESPKDPAIIISDFRRDSKGELPVLKAAFIDGDVFAGNDQLKTLVSLKSKQDLVGDIIGMLQSPAKNVISALNAGGKLANLVKALEERAAKA